MLRDTPFSGTSTDSEVEEIEPISRSNTITSSSTTSESNRPLKTCAPYTAQNMREVSDYQLMIWIVRLSRGVLVCNMDCL